MKAYNQRWTRKAPVVRGSVALALLFLVLGCSNKSQSIDDLPDNAVSTQSQGWTLVTSVDDQGRLVTAVSPKSGYRVNTEFPWRLTVGEIQQTGEQAIRFDEKNARFVTQVDTQDVAALEGQLSFSVCNDKTCLTPRETIHWTKE